MGAELGVGCGTELGVGLGGGVGVGLAAGRVVVWGCVDDCGCAVPAVHGRAVAVDE